MATSRYSANNGVGLSSIPDESTSTNFLTSVGYLITNSHAMYPPSECPTRIISLYFINSFRINSRRNSTNSSILYLSDVGLSLFPKPTRSNA